MLPKQNRLNLSKDFRKFKKYGRNIETRHFKLSYLPTNGEPKFGFVVTTRIGKAHDRNRARRMLREVVRSNLFELPPIEAVLIGRSSLPQASYEEVVASFNQAVSKISLP